MKIGRRVMTGAVKTALAVLVAIAAGCGPKPEPPPPEPPAREESVLTQRQRLDLAGNLMEQGHIGEAADHYREVIEITPDDFEANLNLGIALWTMEDAGFRDERGYAKAELHLRKAAELGRNDPRPHLYLGKIEFERERYGAAIEYLLLATSLDPAGESAYEMLGISLIETGREDAGAEALQTTLEINPRNQVANLALGKIYEKDNRNGLAMRHLERALDANANLDMATYLLERVYYEEGLYAEAEAKCEHFLKYHPGDIQSLEILGWIYKLEGRTADMLAVYDRLTEVKPDNTAYWSPIIQHHMENNQYGEARVLLEKALEHNPYYAYGNVRYGQVLMHYGEQTLASGKRQQALRLFLQARDHLRKAKIDDRYISAATQLISQVEARLQELAGR